MAHRVHLHIGTQKSGTSYLQELLWVNRWVLAQAGLTYPAWSAEAQFLACLDLEGVAFNGSTDPEQVGGWERLVRRVQRAPEAAVISHELFGDASPEVARRAVEDLAPAEVHLVVTVRDLARQLPAVWQEDVKNRHTLGFHGFLDAVDPGTPTEQWITEVFWRRHDVPALLRRWSGVVPPERIHVVTVPPAGAAADALWLRFAAVLGIGPGIVEPLAVPANRSLGLAEAELLRRANERLEGRVSWPRYAGRVTRYLVPDVLVHRGTPPARLPVEAYGWVSQVSERLVGELADAGYAVIGDLADLRVPATPSGPVQVEPAETEMLDVALDALAALLAADELDPPQLLLAERIARRALRLLDRRPVNPLTRTRLAGRRQGSTPFRTADRSSAATGTASVGADEDPRPGGPARQAAGLTGRAAGPTPSTALADGSDEFAGGYRSTS